jgi:hypothetical protein
MGRIAMSGVGQSKYARKTILPAMRVIAIRLDAETENAMKGVRGINWSEVLRRRIREVSRQHIRKNKINAVLVSEELSRRPAGGYDSTRAIRDWRDRRPGVRRAESRITADAESIAKSRRNRHLVP